MKKSVLFGAMALLAGSLVAADSNPKDDINSAAKKLADKGNYSWKKTTDSAGGGGGGGGGGQGRTGPQEGKTEKDGFTFVSTTRGDSAIEAVLKGDKGAVKTADGWKTIAEAAEAEGGQGNPSRSVARTLQGFKAPAAEAMELASKAKELKKAEDAYTGDLTEEGVKELLARGPRRGGGDAPAATNAKGTVKFWVKDGALSKYEYNVQGKINFNGNDRDINRTTTVEIKDVGTTKVVVPEDAKKKIT